MSLMPSYTHERLKRLRLCLNWVQARMTTRQVLQSKHWMTGIILIISLRHAAQTTSSNIGVYAGAWSLLEQMIDKQLLYTAGGSTVSCLLSLFWSILWSGDKDVSAILWVLEQNIWKVLAHWTSRPCSVWRLDHCSDCFCTKKNYQDHNWHVMISI